MKIARRKRAQAGNWVFQPRRCKICVSNQVEPIFSGLFSSGLSALRAIQADSLDEPEPEGRAARPVVNQGSDEPRERIQVHALSEGKLLGLGGNGSDGLHGRPPLSAQGKGDFRPKR